MDILIETHRMAVNSWISFDLLIPAFTIPCSIAGGGASYDFSLPFHSKIPKKDIG